MRTPAAVVAAALLALSGCGGDDAPTDAERFCGEAIANRSILVAPPLTTEAELEATIEFYRLMGELAPVGIASEWNDVVVALETAAELVPGDPESEQLVAATAYATEPSAFRVKEWLQANCGLDIPITTIAPQGGPLTATTTLAPPETTTP
ncbi:MAG: hypothetical protein HKN41_13580 [Ilumatobacter sp.]|nr:hypothetical protein [Ilumatobacter sp.]